MIMGMAVIFLIITGVDYFIVQPPFQLVEKQQAKEDGERVKAEIVYENSKLGELVNDWAYWDDTYRFAQDQNHQYVESNCPDFKLLSQQSNIDLFFIFNSKGEAFLQGGYHPEVKKIVDIHSSFGDTSTVLSMLSPVFKNDENLDGLYYTREGICLLSARPILTTQGKGPSRGVILMGRFLTQSALQALSERVQVKFDLVARLPGELNSSEQKSATSLGPPSPLLKSYFSAGYLYQQYLDIEQKPVFILRSESHGEITTIGRNTGKILKISLLVISFVLLIALLVYRGRMKNTKDSLSESNDRLMTILNSINAIIFIADIETHELLFVNEFGLKAFGHDIVAQKCWKYLQLSKGPCSFCTSNSFVNYGNKGTYGFEFQTEIKSRWYDVTCRSIPWADRKIAKMEVATDITDQKQAEEKKRMFERQLLKTQKDESLARMAGAIAHHCNNLLNIIIGNLELAEDILSEKEIVSSYFKEAVNAAFRATEIGKLMLIYLGHSTIINDTIDLTKACQESISTIQLNDRDGLDIRFSSPPLGPFVYANSDQIRHIVVNLLLNAQESIQGKVGAIEISVRTVSPSEISGEYLFPVDFQAGDRPYACLEVVDNGSGIKKEDIDKIFDPFYSTKFTGRGMGLPVVLGIVKAYEGCISVRSSVEKGSDFCIFLPILDIE